MITPNRLQKGDTVAIVSTARKISKEELNPALQLLESWGLKAILGKTIGAEENQFAGSDDLRAADFQKMLDDQKIKAIWCARGGYGTVRIIDKLDFSAFKKNPKWIVGYSDVTVLHSHIHNFGIETLHAQMCLEIENKTAETGDSIRKVLFGEEYSINFEGSGPATSAGAQVIKGTLIGGNLSVLYSLIGSASEMKTDGKILFIEDLDEILYHIDRMMMNLKRSGYLKNLKALIIGGMTEMKDNKVYFGKTAEEIIVGLVKEYNYPVISGFPAGHINDNRALIFGREVELNVQSSIINIQFSSSKNRKSAI
ncbi:S66 peptidase family protein [Aequorivita lipolytica]|uniref:LD-carboxypeptidase n=1 Tax=Aequorivita lipolytica TaxID=153267 RepID=A0A5C6YSF2_9FLAO|nr:LD-carboxypeptidase [Aequorivita lipolytica]TXD70338.1 LD-carboxypeptidase [Aequorivita lipolytica]